MEPRSRRPFWYLSRGRQTVSVEVDEELRLHLELRERELRARGLSPEEARREARRRFGDVDFTRRYCREQDLRKERRMRWGLGFEEFGRDLRIALRSLGRVPGLSATIVLTVGIALGAATAMVSLVRAVLVAPLPYEDPSSLVWIYTDNPPFKFRFSHVDYRALEADHPAFAAVAAYETRAATFTDGGQAERVTVKSVTGSYFPLLGQRAHLGRLFGPADDRHNESLAVLTHAYWVRRFASDPAVLGRPMSLDGTTHTIVGVLQPEVGPLENGVGVVTVARWPVPQRKGPFFTMAIGRLRSDVSWSVARETLHATNRRLFPIWRSSYQDEKATWGLMDLKARAIGEIGTPLLFVSCAIGCLLLIACANAVNLLLARGLQRTRELAIRGALGASRPRLLQHVLVEAGALAAGAALVAVAVAVVALRLVTDYGADYIPRINEVRFSPADLAWLAVLTFIAAVSIGIVPAWQGSRVIADRALASGRSMTESPAARRVRRALVAAEFALATPLLVAGGLVFASLDRLGRVPVGVDTDRLYTAAVSLPQARYATGEARAAFWTRARERLAELPGVEVAALADSRPPREAGQTNNFDLRDRPTPPGQNQPLCTWVGATPEFFAAVGLRLERGRLLDERSADENAIVVDRAWAERFFAGEEVVGRQRRSGGCTTCPWTTVIGVVGNVKWRGLAASGEEGTVYFPFVADQNAFVVLRASVEPASLTASLRQAVRELDPGLPLTDVATGNDLIDEALATPRYLTALTSVFAAAALALAVIGIYGVMSHFVQQHRREIGIQLALGGEPARVRRGVVRRGMILVLFGVAGGIVVALAAGRLIAALLFGISPTDPGVLIGVPAALASLALVACLVPAQRAARLDPAEILREE
jgi:predicted permease